MNSESDKNLERLIHQTLRALPDRKAPGTLEHRVLAAIAARQSLPWWHRSFVSWPTPVKLAFMGGTVAIAAVAARLDSSSSASVSQALADVQAMVLPLRTTAETVKGYGESLFAGIPSVWIYGALGFIGTLYAALLGLGTAAYKTLISNH